jgi:hypothetical protein
MPNALITSDTEQKPKVDVGEVARAMGYSAERREVMKKMFAKGKREPKDRGNRANRAVMNAEFMEFLDKEKAKGVSSLLRNDGRC